MFIFQQEPHTHQAFAESILFAFTHSYTQTSKGAALTRFPRPAILSALHGRKLHSYRDSSRTAYR